MAKQQSSLFDSWCTSAAKKPAKNQTSSQDACDEDVSLEGGSVSSIGPSAGGSPSEDLD